MGQAPGLEKVWRRRCDSVQAVCTLEPWRAEFGGMSNPKREVVLRTHHSHGNHCDALLEGAAGARRSQATRCGNSSRSLAWNSSTKALKPSAEGDVLPWNGAIFR